MDTSKMVSKLDNIKDDLPDTISSIYDICTVLGACKFAESAAERQMDMEKIIYFTPEYPEQYLNQSDSFLVINLVTRQNELVFQSVDLRPYTKKDMSNHLFHGVTTSSKDKSITQKSNDKDVEYLLNKPTYSPLVRAYKKWATDVAKDFSVEIDWLSRLQNLSKSEEQKIRSNVKSKLNQSGGKMDGFISLTIDGDPPTKWENYQEILRKLVAEDRYTNNSITSVNESGVDIVTGKETEVLGVSSGPPWDYQTSKIQEQYPQVNAENGYMRRPFSLKTSLFMSEGSTMIEDLSYYLSFSRTSEYDLSLYVVPHPEEEYTLKDAVNWYEKLSDISEESGLDQLELLYSSNAPKTQSNFGEEFEQYLSSDLSSLADTIYVSVQNNGANKDTEIQNYQVNSDQLEVIQSQIKTILKNQIGSLRTRNSGFISEDVTVPELSGTLFNPYWISANLTGRISEGSRSNDVGVSSLEFQIPRSVLSDEPLSYYAVIESFVEYLRSEIHSVNLSGGTYDEKYRFCETVTRQQLVLELLTERGIVTKDLSEVNFNGSYMSSEVNEFIEENSFIEGTSAQYPYLIGKLVGEISYHQSEKNNISRPLFRQYSVDFFSTSTYQEVVSGTIEKILQYSTKSGANPSGVVLYEYDISDLSAALQEKPVEEWDLTEQEMKYYYSLGLADGISY